MLHALSCDDHSVLLCSSMSTADMFICLLQVLEVLLKVTEQPGLIDALDKSAFKLMTLEQVRAAEAILTGKDKVPGFAADVSRLVAQRRQELDPSGLICVLFIAFLILAVIAGCSSGEA